MALKLGITLVALGCIASFVGFGAALWTAAVIGVCLGWRGIGSVAVNSDWPGWVVSIFLFGGFALPLVGAVALFVNIGWIPAVAALALVFVV